MLAEYDYGQSVPAPHLSWQSLSAFVQRAPFGIYVVDADFRIALINTKAQECVFRNVNPAVGRDFSEAIRVLWPKALADDIIAEFRRTLTTGAPYHCQDYVQPRADLGTVEAYDWDLYRLALPDGRHGVVCYYYETTRLRKIQRALHQSEERQAFLLKLSDLLRPLTDPSAIQEIACRLVGERLRTDRVAYCEVDARDGEVVVIHEWQRAGVAPATGRYRPGTFGALFTPPLRDGQSPAVVDDAAHDARVPPEQFALWEKVGVRAAVVYPLVKHDQFVAGFLAHQTTARHWSHDDIALISEVGERVWAAVERARAESALRRNAERQAFLLKFSDMLRVQPNEDSVCNLSLEQLAGALHVDDCYLMTVDVTADQAVVTHHVGRAEARPVPYNVRMSDFPTPLQDSFERTVVCHDAVKDAALTDLDRQSLAAMQVGAFVGASVRHGDKNPIWALSVSCTAPRHWTTDEVALIENVAERTWAAVERARAEQALRDADNRKDEFLAMLAHELRNPLAAINNAGQILTRSGADPDTLRKTAEILNRQVGHMVRQVDDLLDMSRITRGKIELRRECVNLGKIAAQAIESSRALIEGSRHELNVSLPENPIYVLGDPIRLAQVIGNLLNNAAKFTNRGGRIWLSLEQDNHEAVLRVRDNGIGISSDDQQQIFELFVQLDKSLGRVRDGLGIGLALVRKLMELHGGSVAVHSKGLTQGTEFVLRLPTLTSLMPPPDENAETPPVAPRRVLVVDDNRDSADSLATLLTLMGHAVDTAHDGVEAVKKAVTFKADLILLDIGMPRLNGYEAAKWIREQGHKNLTIVALTGWGQEEDRRLSAEAGFDKHVVKPIDIQTLTKLLAEAGPSEA